jgi:hypothetical protein
VSAERTTDLARFAALLWRAGDVREVRIPGPGRTDAGYFDSPDALVAAVAPLDGRRNVYVTVNPVDPALLGRGNNRIVPRVRATTADAQVARRRWLPIDIDPRRPAGVSASEAEREAALAVTRNVWRCLAGRGWPEPVTAMSGNGYWLLYPVDLPNDPDAKRLVEGVLAHLAARFDTDAVSIDTSVANASRIVALIGTLKVKGDPTPDRPHRRSALVRVPAELPPVPPALLAELAAPAAPQADRGSTVVAGERMPAGWVAALLDAAGVAYRAGSRGQQTWYRLERCPFHPDDDRGGDCGVGEDADGKGMGHCFHSRGAGRGWQDFKAALGLVPATAPRFGGPGAEEELLAAALASPAEPAAGWPEPPDDAVYHGPLGEVVRAVAPHTEADPVGVLGTLLASVGAAMGGLRYIYQGSAQAPNLFVVLVGDSSTGRKGTAGSIAREVMNRAYPEWASLIVAGLGSGEGLVGRLKAGEKSGEPRALVMESEFGRLLTVMGREGSTLSPMVRDAWDGVPMGRVLAREQSIVHTHHIGVVGHVTPVELRARLSGTDAANGFGNRFIWLGVRRTRLVPFPVSPVERVDPGLFAAVGAAIEDAQAPGEVPWSPQARDAWEDLYLELSMRRRYGLLGAMTARAEAQVVRLALVYALLDRSGAIDVPHLRAARALWDYAERSVSSIFGDSTGDRHADALRAQLADGPLKWEDAKRALGVRSAAELEVAVALLESLGIAERAKVRVPGAKRPATVIRLARTTTTTTTTALEPAHEMGD